MPGWRDLMTMLRADAAPERIVRTLRVRPSRMRELLGSRRLREALEVERQVAEAQRNAAAQRRAERMLDRLEELATSGETETARKACSEVLAVSRQEAGDAAGGLDAPAELPPWRLLDRPQTQPMSQGRPSRSVGGGRRSPAGRAAGTGRPRGANAPAAGRSGEKRTAARRAREEGA